jgi:hypothetical protein
LPYRAAQGRDSGGRGTSTAAPEALAGYWRAQPERSYNQDGAGGFQGATLGKLKVATGTGRRSIV